jgi:hypothetical protein
MTILGAVSLGTQPTTGWDKADPRESREYTKDTKATKEGKGAELSHSNSRQSILKQGQVDYSFCFFVSFASFESFVVQSRQGA